MQPFRRVAILGAGLLGGSLAMALRACSRDVHVQLWARRESVAEAARLQKAADFCSIDLEEVVRDCDLIVFAVPVGSMLPLAEMILPFVDPSAVLTDVGSVKGFVHESLGRFCREHSLSFIGSHPMAGSEKQGIAHASSGLFRDATVVVTGEASEDLDRVKLFWQSVGGVCVHMSPEDHDRSVAAISHMPHSLAAICSMAAGDCGHWAEVGKLSAGGFRDTTRVAMGEPSMWSEILMENSKLLMNSLECCKARMTELCGFLESGDKDGLARWLEEAKESRERIISSRP